MTSDNSSNGGQRKSGPPISRAGNGNPGSGGRKERPNQGDLWSDEPQTAPSPPDTGATASPDAPSAPEEAEAVPKLLGSRLEPATTLEPPARPGRGVAPPPPEPAYDEPDYYYDDEYYDDRGHGVMFNPFVLAAGVVAAAVLLAIFVVFVFGRDNGNGGGANANVTVTASGASDGGIAVGLMARSVATATVREGPGPTYLELGLLRANQDVDVTGRNEDATWYQIVFPADSQLRGWVPESALSLPEGAADEVALADVTPVSRPEIPATSTPVPQPTAEATPEESPTPEPGDEADIALTISSDCTPNTAVVLHLTNQGETTLEASPIQVTVSFDGDVEYDQVFEADMPPGANAPLNTGVLAQPSTTMTVAVALTGLEDADPSNNSASCQISGGGNNNDDDEEDEGAGNVPPPIQTLTAGNEEQ